MNFILWMMCCGLGGTSAGVISVVWSGGLLKARGKDYKFTGMLQAAVIVLCSLAGLVFAFIDTGTAVLICAFLLLLVSGTVSLTDWSCRIIPNQTVLTICALKLVGGLPTIFGLEGFLPFDIVQSLLGLAACFLIFAAPALFGKRVGAGDIKLAAAAGFFLGFDLALIAVVIMGVLIIAYGMLQRKMPVLDFMKSEIPMGPFIVVGTVAAFLGSFFIG